MKRSSLGQKGGAALLSAIFLLSSCKQTDTTSTGVDTSSAASETTSVTVSTSDVKSTSDGETVASSETSGSTEDSSAPVITQTSAESWSPSATSETQDLEDVFSPDHNKMTDAHDELAEEFRKLPGVVNVVKKPNYEDNQYILIYEMPIDHNDPDKGTFQQRVFINLKSKDAPNQFTIGGYNLYYGMYDGGYYDEAEPLFAKTYGCNLIEPEYRFDGLSKPEGFSNEKADYWEYLTCEQASEDFHFIMESLKTMLTGKWCIEGMSKGGEFTAYQLSRYPDDADLFVAECAMLKMGENTPGLYDYIYNTAGDDRYGKEKAKKYRELLLEFQVEMIKHRDDLQDDYWYEATHVYNMQFASTFTKEILFDCTVLDLSHLYQYESEGELEDDARGDIFKKMQDTLELKDATGPTEKGLFRKNAFEVLNNLYGPWQYAYVDTASSSPEVGNLYGFMLQCYHEDGYFDYDFSYLREALEKDGSGASLYITKEMEPEVYGYRIADHHKNLSYRPDVTEARIRAVETTQKPLILVNGLSDLYQVAEVKECDNPNTHIFNIPSSFHDEISLEYLSEEQFKEYDAIVREALGI